MANLSNINNKFLVTTGGNVGIGVTGPLYKLEASGADFNFVGKFQATGTGYAPASILLETTGSASRGQGMYHYNTTADENWFTGVPYNVDSQKWIVAHQSSTSQLVETAQLTHALLTIASLTGNVGIGETSPGTKLVVSGNNDAAGTGVLEIKTTGTNLRIGGNTTYSWIQSHSSNPLYINQLGNNIILNLGGGKVGIGTPSPDSPLEIQNVPAQGSQKMMLHLDANHTGNQGSAFLRISAGSSSGANTKIETVSSGGQGLFGTYTDTNIINSGTSTGAYGNINFITGSSTSASSIVMTIGGGSQKGKVGIGTLSPSKLLHVDGSYKLGTNAYIQYDAGYPYTITTANTAAVGNLVFSAGLGSAAYESRIDLQGSNTAGAAGITLSTASSPRIIVTPDGKVNIGTTGNFSAGKLVIQNDGRENGGILDIQTGGGYRYYTRVLHNTTTSSTAGYWHIKTNIPIGGNVMFLAKFYGYIYGSGQVLDLSHVGYAYAGTSTVINQGVTNNGSNTNASSAVYTSTDSKLCFRVAFGTGATFSTYFAGVYMDMSFPCPGGNGHDLEIEAQTFNQSATVY